jgi:hypothetical protein
MKATRNPAIIDTSQSRKTSEIIFSAGGAGDPPAMFGDSPNILSPFFRRAKVAVFLSGLSLAALTACSTPSSNPANISPSNIPETVMVTYHVKSGSEAEFQDLLTRVWKIYQSEHLVFAQPHIIVRDKGADDKPRFVEIFTWVSHDAPANAPDAVTALWKQEHSLCEDRGGHPALEGGEVKLLAPTR